LSFQTVRSAAAQLAACREGMSAEGKHNKCVVIFPSEQSHKCASEIFSMQSSARVRKGGRVAFPVS